MFWLTNKNLNIIKNTIIKFPEIEQWILFWSRSMGNYKKWSDIDIAIKWKNINLDTVSRLHGILEDETPLPYFFDIVDYNTINNTELIEHIDQCWKCFYEK